MKHLYSLLFFALFASCNLSDSEAPQPLDLEKDLAIEDFSGQDFSEPDLDDIAVDSGNDLNLNNESPPTCNNGIKEEGEDCDQDDFGPHSCESLGFENGALECTDQCKLITAGCSSCGDNLITGNEECESGSLGQRTCASELQNITASGTLSCLDCKVVHDDCSPIVQLATNANQICALRSNDKVSCWGEGPLATPPTTSFVRIELGYSTGCGIRADGKIECWGYNSYEVNQVPSATYSKFSVGGYYVCAIDENTALRCWGYAFRDAIPPSGSFLEVAAGSAHACAIRSDQTIVCWGEPGIEVRTTAPPGPFIEITAGYSHTCARRQDGSVSCWGDPAVPSSPKGTFTSIRSEAQRTCGRKSDGRVTCWGSVFGTPIREGEISVYTASCFLFSDGDIDCIDRVSPLKSIKSIEVGNFREICTLNNEGVLKCWGRNSPSSYPPPFERFSAISINGRRQVGIRTDGTLLRWGSGFGALPAGKFKQISLGTRYACGVREDDSLACWGESPSPPPTGALFKKVFAGTSGQGCALKRDNTAVCWGTRSPAPSGTVLDIGIGEYDEPIWISAQGELQTVRSLPPTPWNNTYVKLDIFPSLFQPNGCALTSQGEIQCWSRQRPVRLFNGPFTDFSVGEYRVCGLKMNGEITCQYIF